MALLLLPFEAHVPGDGLLASDELVDIEARHPNREHGGRKRGRRIGDAEVCVKEKHCQGGKRVLCSLLALTASEKICRAERAPEKK